MRRCTAAVLLLLLCAPFTVPLAAEAQYVRWPNPISDVSAREALEESKRTKRLVLLIQGGGSVDWSSPTVAAWITWHAVAVRLEHPRDRAVIRQLRALGAKPGIHVFKNGHYARTISVRDWRQKDLTSQLLLDADQFLTAQETQDPVWFALHNERNPQPARPPAPEPLHMSADEHAPRVFDPLEPGTDDVLDRLEWARMLARDGYVREAAAYYTWLWERAEAIDPAMRAARVQWIAAEMKDLAWKDASARERFRALRDRMYATQLWWTFDEFIDYTVLNTIVGEVEHSVEYFDRFLNDGWLEGPTLARAERAALRSIADMPDWTDPEAVAPDALARLKTLAAAAGETPGLADDDPVIRERARALRRRIVVDEGCRLYAALLVRGDETLAAEAAAIVLGCQDGAPARLALVASAAAAGQPRTARHVAWLDEARELGQDHPELREWLEGRRPTEPRLDELQHAEPGTMAPPSD